jgi:hypothetical protein
VDIVALYDPWRSPVRGTDWQWLFNRIAYILANSSRVTGTVRLGDKCVKLSATAVNVDIVPAVSETTYSLVDPVMIYSRREFTETRNYPRTHYQNGVAKQAATNDVYKATVRLFKRWALQYQDLVAPSFYVECAVHSVPAAEFDTYLPLSFARVGLKLMRYSRYEIIKSVAGDKDILVTNEWHPDHFVVFQQKLHSDIKRVIDAMAASTRSEADQLWRLAFGD